MRSQSSRTRTCVRIISTKDAVSKRHPGTSRPWAAAALFATAIGTRAGGSRSAVGLKPLFQCSPRTMQTNHGVVGRDPKLRSHLRDGHAIDDHSPQNAGVFGLELFSLDEDAPTIDALVVDGGELELVDPNHGHLLFSQLIEQYIAHDASNPSLGPSWVSDLFSALQGPLERHMKHLVGIDLTAAAPTDQREQLLALCPEGGADCVSRPGGVAPHLHGAVNPAPKCPVLQPRGSRWSRQ